MLLKTYFDRHEPYPPLQRIESASVRPQARVGGTVSAVMGRDLRCGVIMEEGRAGGECVGVEDGVVGLVLV